MFLRNKKKPKRQKMEPIRMQQMTREKRVARGPGRKNRREKNRHSGSRRMGVVDHLQRKDGKLNLKTVAKKGFQYQPKTRGREGGGKSANSRITRGARQNVFRVERTKVGQGMGHYHACGDKTLKKNRKQVEGSNSMRLNPKSIRRPLGGWHNA